MDFERFANAFLEESRELLDKMELSLMELEKDFDNRDHIDTIFRALHTIKGSGNMFGFSEVASFSHELEGFLSELRAGKFPATSEFIGELLEAKDAIRSMLDGADTEEEKNERLRIVERIRGLVQNALGANGQSTAKAAQGQGDANKEQAEKMKASAPQAIEKASTQESAKQGYAAWKEPKKRKVFRINFEPEAQILLSGFQLLPLFESLKDLGECKIRAICDNIPSISMINPELCYLHWSIIMATEYVENDIKDAFIFVEGRAEIQIDQIDDSGDKKIGEILADRGSISRDVIAEIASEQRPFGQIALEKALVTQDELKAALDEQESIRESRKTSKDKAVSATTRVKNESLDKLVNLVGELVTLQARLSRESSVHDVPTIKGISEAFERLMADLRENSMSIRMVPLTETLTSYMRLVRDLSKDLGKEIALELDGGDTELDKNIIEDLKDPLMHLVRNAADHGIELPDERVAAGKPSAGKILIKAENAGSNVIIRVSDDGAGLDREAILARAIERGLTASRQDLSDAEIFAFIFEPGFSTAKVVTNVSGRGVGMDVVKRNLERLNGTIAIESERGKGSCFVLTIPLTLSIIDGFMVEVAQERFILNLSIVRECVAAEGSGGNERIMKVRGELIPRIDLREVLELEGTGNEYPKAVIAEFNGGCAAFIVDRVIGQCQTVVKPLGRALKGAIFMSGATILGDGDVALILDAQKIFDASAKPRNPGSALNT